MNRIFLFLFSIFVLSNSYVIGQANLLNARVPQDVGQLNEKQVEANDEEPLPYGFIDDRDVLWSKTVWEIIDLDERINFPLYYPEEPENLGEERKSLFDVIMTGIRDGRIKEIYKGGGQGYFREKMTYQQVLDEMKGEFQLPTYADVFNDTGFNFPLLKTSILFFSILNFNPISSIIFKKDLI